MATKEPWSFSKAGSVYVSEDDPYSAFENQTLYARWERVCSKDSHPYTARITAPSCIEAGYTEYICTICGDSYRDNFVAAIDHRYAEGFCILCGKRDSSFVPGYCHGGKDCPCGAFHDYPKPYEWSHDGIDFCVGNGLFFGVSETRFAPDETITRAMLVTVLYRLEGTPPADASNPFNDVAEQSWYTGTVIWGVENGIVSGIGNGRFAPDAPVTREQVAVILYRYAAYHGYDVTFFADLTGFSDASHISAWAHEAVCWAVDVGVVNGSSHRQGLYLNPQDNAARAHVAAILMRFIQQFM